MAILKLSDYALYSGSISKYLPLFLADKTYSEIFVIADQNTVVHCWPQLQPLLSAYNVKVITVQAGETHKTLDTCQQIWHNMMECKATRKALVVNLGGGVIGDMGGFCAATYKRGVDFVQMPTTLLSQVDASVGGKLGIDFGNIKNSVGLFQNPQAVFLDASFFDALPWRELRSGLAEIIKHALIADAQQWTIISAHNWQELEWENVAFESVHIKKDIVEEDPFEQGIRKALNFGHTIGHAIESYYLHTATPLLHGEAIAIGMITEAWLSHKLLGLTAQELEAITTYIIKVYGHVDIQNADTEELLAFMRNDKKNEKIGINCSLLPQIGKVKVNNYIEEELILQSLNYYSKL